MTLPNDKQARKERPMARGLLDYFPDALTEVAHVSFVGNQQHNPGEELHWAREKSKDHADCIIRHLVDRGKLDDDGILHDAKVAWRALAMLQLALEDWEEAVPPSRPFNSDDIENDIVELNVPWRTAPEGARVQEQNVWDTLAHRGFTLSPEMKAALRDETPLLCLFKVEDQDDQGEVNIFADEDDVPTHQAILWKRLVSAGAPAETRSLLRRSLRPAAAYADRHKFTYICGPMRGCLDHNFPAFDETAEARQKQGFHVLSPADIDRNAGFDSETDNPSAPEMIREFVRRDFFAIYALRPEQGDELTVLPGWEKSTGALAEITLARWLGIPVRTPQGQPVGGWFNIVTLNRVFEEYMKYDKGVINVED